MKSRNWCFTLNNPSCELLEAYITWEEYSYMIFGFEVGESGTEHLQGYMEFDHPVPLGLIRKHLDHGHWETRKGNQMKAIKYCMRDGEWYEFGKKKDQGKRSDIAICVDILTHGGTMKDISSLNPDVYVRYGNFQWKKHSYVITKRSYLHGMVNPLLFMKDQSI